MPLAVVASPETESDLAIVVSLLVAHKIPHIVHNAGFGGLYPGPQINAYNNRRVMVHDSYEDDAMDVLSVLSSPNESGVVPVETGFHTKFCLVAEFILFGWFVPRASDKTFEEYT